ncbi:MAG: 2-C-methyl-D-erythritol 4-phosphate cytidylyltransferase [Moraxella sp.]|nr:2-C-methyl-D-erythritol 4-phosphate cytidylyltransferase [Moraxella sp.]
MLHDVHALLVAAGNGSRFGAQTPKQYLKVAGKTVLEHSIDRLMLSQISDVTVVLADGDDVAKGLSVADKPVFFAVGGSERFLSVRSGILAIRQRGAKDDDWVLIHDAARPCVPTSDVQRLLDVACQLKKEAGAILATPVADTLKLVDGDDIKQTVSRQHLWQAQTPQIFRLADLESMFAAVLKKQVVITDEASGFELLGKAVKVVSGSKLNLKLTYPEDLAMIGLILAQMDN